MLDWHTLKPRLQLFATGAHIFFTGIQAAYTIFANSRKFVKILDNYYSSAELQQELTCLNSLPSDPSWNSSSPLCVYPAKHPVFRTTTYSSITNINIIRVTDAVLLTGGLIGKHGTNDVAYLLTASIGPSCWGYSTSLEYAANVQLVEHNFKLLAKGALANITNADTASIQGFLSSTKFNLFYSSGPEFFRITFLDTAIRPLWNSHLPLTLLKPHIGDFAFNLVFAWTTVSTFELRQEIVRTKAKLILSALKHVSLVPTDDSLKSQSMFNVTEWVGKYTCLALIERSNLSCFSCATNHSNNEDLGLVGVENIERISAT